METCLVLVLALITVYRKQLSTNDEYRESNRTRKAQSGDSSSNDEAICDAPEEETLSSMDVDVTISSAASKPKLGLEAPIEPGSCLRLSGRQTFPDLSMDILFVIAEYLDSGSIIRLSMCNRFLREAMLCDRLWQQLFRLAFGDLLRTPYVLAILRARNLSISDPVIQNEKLQMAAVRAGGWLRFCLVWEVQWQDWLCAGLCTNERAVLAFEDRLYDVTRFLSQHPGSPETLAEHCGGEVSDVYAEIGHSTVAHSLRDSYLVFDAQSVCRRSPSRSASESLRDEFRQRQYELSETRRLSLFTLQNDETLATQLRVLQGDTESDCALSLDREPTTSMTDVWLTTDEESEGEEQMAAEDADDAESSDESLSEQTTRQDDHDSDLGTQPLEKRLRNWHRRFNVRGQKLVRSLRYWDEARCRSLPPTDFSRILRVAHTHWHLHPMQRMMAQPVSLLASAVHAVAQAMDLDLQPLLHVVAAASEHVEDDDAPAAAAAAGAAAATNVAPSSSAQPKMGNHSLQTTALSDTDRPLRESGEGALDPTARGPALLPFLPLRVAVQQGSQAKCRHEGNGRVFFDPLCWRWTLWFSCCGRCFVLPPLRSTLRSAAAPLAVESVETAEQGVRDKPLTGSGAESGVAIEEDGEEVMPGISAKFLAGSAAGAQLMNDTAAAPGEAAEVEDPVEGEAPSGASRSASLASLTSLTSLASLSSVPGLSQSVALTRRVSDALSRSASLTINGLTQQLGTVLQNSSSGPVGETRQRRLLRRLQKEPLVALTLPPLPPPPAA